MSLNVVVHFGVKISPFVDKKILMIVRRSKPTPLFCIKKKRQKKKMQGTINENLVHQFVCTYSHFFTTRCFTAFYGVLARLNGLHVEYQFFFIGHMCVIQDCA